MKYRRPLRGGIVFINKSQLSTVPRIAILRSNDATLSGTGDRLELSAKRKVDELYVMNGHVRAWVASLNPFCKLSATDRFRSSSEQ